MDDTKKMLHAIINGQSSMKSELIMKIDGVEKKLSGRIDGLEEKIGKVEKNLTKRINKLGKQLCFFVNDNCGKIPSRAYRLGSSFHHPNFRI